MSQWAESSGGSMASRRMHGDRSSRTADLVSVPVGEETGLPLVPCPDCKLARVIERRSKKENHNLGRVYFKCPRDGYVKHCGYYRFQRQYFEQLKELEVIQVRQLQSEEEEEEEGSEGRSNGKADRNAMELNLQKLQWKMNMLILCCVLVVGFGIMYVVLK